MKSAGRITGMFFSVVLPGGVCLAEPGVTLSLVAGPPGTGISASGSGFPASELHGTNRVTAVVAIVTGDAAQVPFNVGINWTQFGFASRK